MTMCRHSTVALALTIAATAYTACATPDTKAPEPQTHEGAMHSRHDRHETHGKHAKHAHRFEDPSKYAARWNDPARDEWQKPNEIIGLMGVEEGMTVADLGAGTGYMLPHLSRAVGASGEVIALDVEPAMITYLDENLSSFGGNVRTLAVPFDSPGVGADALDRLVTINTWHHVEGREAYAAKVHDALRPGGRFVVVEFTMDAPIGAPKEMRVDAATVAAELEAGGFEVSIAEETLPNHHVVVGVKR